MEEQQRKKVLGVLFLGVLMGALDLAVIGPALPAIQAEFGMGSRSLAWIFNIYVLFQLIGTPLMAKLSDRFGRRSIYVTCLLLFAGGSLMLVLAPTFGVLLLGRAIQGFGAGGIFPVAAAVIGDTFPAEKRGPTLGLLGAVFGIAFLLGPILGGILLRWSWNWLFLINLPIVAVLVWQALKLLPSAGAADRQPFDTGGAVTLSLLLGSLAVALTEIDSANLPASLASPTVGPFLLLAAVLLPVFWRLEQRAIDPVLRPSLLGSTQLRLACAIGIGAGTLEAGSAFFPALAVSSLGVTDYNASLLTLPAVLATAVGSPIMGRLLNAWGSRTVVQLGLLGICAGALIYGLLDLSVFWFILGGIIGGFGFASLLGAPLRFIVLNDAAPRDRGVAQGILTVFLAVGQLVGAAVVGGVAASRGGGSAGYQMAYLILGILTGLLVLVGFGLKSRGEEQAAAVA